MTEKIDMDRKRVQVFFDSQTKIHISKTNGTFYNGYIEHISSDFFFLNDDKTGRQLIFFIELDRPIEEFKNKEGERNGKD